MIGLEINLNQPLKQLFPNSPVRILLYSTVATPDK